MTPTSTRLRSTTVLAVCALLVGTTACSGERHTNVHEPEGTEVAQEHDSRQVPPEPPDVAESESGGRDRPQAQLGQRSFADVVPEPKRTDEPFQATSTFAIDIDTASYDYARRTIAAGSLPSPENIRSEEFINAFRQDYPEPASDGFTVTADGSRLPTWPGTREEAVANMRLLRVGLQTRSETHARRPDAALTFVIDQSGSMAEPGRLDLVKEALHTLVEELRPTDSVAIVAYSDEAKVVQPMTRISRKAALHSAIDELQPDGSTNLEQGMVLGYRTAREGFRPDATNRVILLSDGLANTGNTTAEPILARVKEEAGKGIALLCVGVGSEYGDVLMERLADQGDGFAVYVSERRQAEKLFVSRLPATLTVRALDAKAQVRFDPAVVETYRLIGYENRTLRDEDFRNDSVDGGEVGPGHSVTAFYTVRLREDAAHDPSREVAEARVRWLDPQTRVPSEAAGTVTVGDLEGAYETAPDRFRIAYTASAFAESLQARMGSGLGVGPTFLDALAREAERLAARTEDRDVADLATMIRRTIRLAEG